MKDYDKYKFYRGIHLQISRLPVQAENENRDAFRRRWILVNHWHFLSARQSIFNVYHFVCLLIAWNMCFFLWQCTTFIVISWLLTCWLLTAKRKKITVIFSWILVHQNEKVLKVYFFFFKAAYYCDWWRPASRCIFFITCDSVLFSWVCLGQGSDDEKQWHAVLVHQSGI